jgi:hypothetical protein
MIPTLQSSPYFGYSVSISGNGEYIAIGAPGETFSGVEYGFVAIFRATDESATGYELVQVLRLGDEYEGIDGFGSDVLLGRDGDYLFVTASKGEVRYLWGYMYLCEAKKKKRFSTKTNSYTVTFYALC